MPEQDRQAEETHRKIEQARNRAAEVLQQLQAAAQAGDPATAERLGKQLAELLKNPLLPRDFVREAGARGRALEASANMVAVDRALDRAMHSAVADNREKRNQEIAAAREWLRKAGGLGSSRELTQIAERKIQVILLSGGVRHDGATRAKPLDTTPRPPNQAKGEPARAP